MTENDRDADSVHPWATLYRIPRISTPYPQRNYEVALCVPSGPGTSMWGAVEPGSTAEAAIIGSLIDFRRTYYRPSYAAEMLKKTFDTDDTTNTIVLMCTAEGWKYRRATHRHEPWPCFPHLARQAEFPPTPMGLIALLDHIYQHHDRWQEWKTAHSAVFEQQRDTSSGSGDGATGRAS